MATITMYYIVRDSDGDVSRIEIDIPTATPIATVLAAVPAFGNLIAPLVSGGLVAAGFNLEVPVVGWSPIVEGFISDVQEKAEFVFRTVGNFVKRLNLPTFIETFFEGGGATKQVNLSLPDVAAFIDAMVDGLDVGGTLVEPVDSRGEEFTVLEAARENWGKRRL